VAGGENDEAKIYVFTFQESNDSPPMTI